MVRISSLDISKDIAREKHMQAHAARRDPPEDHIVADVSSESDPKRARWLDIGIMLIMVLILISVTISIRMMTVDMPYFDDRAEQVMDQRLQSTIASQVSSEPGLLPGERSAEAARRYELQKKSPEMKEAIDNLASQYKSYYRDPDGMNYLYGGDPYYYLSQTRGIIEEGITPRQNLPYIYAGIYRILSIFSPSMELKQAVFYIPVMFGVIAVLLMFFIARKLAGDAGGFIAGLFLALSPSFLLNTRAGFIDTNSFNIMISLCIVLLFLYTMDMKKGSYFTGAGLLLSLAAFGMIWNGWFYILCILAGYLIVLFAYISIIRARHDRKWFWTLVGVIASGIIAILLFATSKYMRNIILKFRLKETFFPSGMLTVAELQGYSFMDLLSRLAGPIFFCIALCAVVSIIYRLLKNMKQDNDWKAIFDSSRDILFIAFYILILFFVPLFAKRFTIYLLPAYALAIGYGIFLLLPYIQKFIASIHLNMNKRIIRYIVIGLISALMILSIQPALKANMRTIPHMNDAIYNTAVEIRDNSGEDARIDLWWDYGYLYEAISEREVLFHGGSFDSPKLHWISRALLTDDENLSAGILRMLDCKGEDKAFTLLSKTNDEKDSMQILYDLVSFDGVEAQSYIDKNGLPQKILDYTHCVPPESFMVVGSELSTKMSVLNYYANFDFTKNYDKMSIEGMGYDEAVEYFMGEYNLSAKEAEKQYLDVLSYDPKEIRSATFISDIIQCDSTGSTLACDKYMIDLADMDARAGNMHPSAFIYYDGEVNRTHYDDALYPYTMVVMKRGATYDFFLLNPEFDGSVLVSLLFFDGADLEHFSLFHIENIPQRVNSYRIIYS